MTCAQGLLRLLWGGPKLECYGTAHSNMQLGSVLDLLVGYCTTCVPQLFLSKLHAHKQRILPILSFGDGSNQTDFKSVGTVLQHSIAAQISICGKCV